MSLLYKIQDLIPSQLKKFLIVGFLTALLDFSIYQIILSFDLTSISYAKGISFVCGTIFSYAFNKTWTFLHISNYFRTSIKFIILYMTTFFLNVNINSIFLNILGGYEYAIYISFIVATACSALCNFLGMKLIVFRN